MDTSIQLHSQGQPLKLQYDNLQELVLRARVLVEGGTPTEGMAIKLSQLEAWYRQLQEVHSATTGASTSAAATPAAPTTSAAAPLHVVVLPPATAGGRATATHVRSAPNEDAIKEEEMGYCNVDTSSDDMDELEESDS
jgi:hypothetical protein